MNKIHIASVSGVCQGATPVLCVIPEFLRSKALVRRFSALGNNAASKAVFYVPSASRTFLLIESVAAAGTAIKIPVDTAGSLVFNGNALTAVNKLLLQTPKGWVLTSATFAAVPGEKYCTATIPAAVGAMPANTRASRASAGAFWGIPT